MHSHFKRNETSNYIIVIEAIYELRSHSLLIGQTLVLKSEKKQLPLAQYQSDDGFSRKESFLPTKHFLKKIMLFSS